MGCLRPFTAAFPRTPGENDAGESVAFRHGFYFNHHPATAKSKVLQGISNRFVSRSSRLESTAPVAGAWLESNVFSTYTIPTLSTGGGFASPGIFVARDRAYVAEINANTLAVAQVWQYNVSNPASPTVTVPASNGTIEGRADYVTGEDNSVEADTKTLVAAIRYSR